MNKIILLFFFGILQVFADNNESSNCQTLDSKDSILFNQVKNNIGFLIGFPAFNYYDSINLKNSRIKCTQDFFQCNILQVGVVFFYKIKPINNKLSYGSFASISFLFRSDLNLKYMSCPNILITAMIGINWKKFSLDFLIGCGIGMLFTFNTHHRFNFSIFIGYEFISLLMLADALIFDANPNDFVVVFTKHKFFKNSLNIAKCCISLLNVNFIFSWKVGKEAL